MKIATCIILFVTISIVYRICLAILEEKNKGLADIGLKVIKRKYPRSYYVCLVLLISAWLSLLAAIFMLFSLLFKGDV